jgi:uncharacterized metal-binding protein YceD (DUF177 family)
VSPGGMGSIFSHVVELDRVGPKGLLVKLDTDEAARKALAAQMRITAVLAFRAEVKVTPDAGLKGQYRVTGELDAEVVQSCIVSLEPVQQMVSATFERLYAPAESLKPAADPGEDEAEWLDPDAEDPADPITDGRIDLGAVAAEELALALDPYPRKADAGLPVGYKPDAEAAAKVSPFAVRS